MIPDRPGRTRILGPARHLRPRWAAWRRGIEPGAASWLGRGGLFTRAISDGRHQRRAQLLVKRPMRHYRRPSCWPCLVCKLRYQADLPLLRRVAGGGRQSGEAPGGDIPAPFRQENLVAGAGHNDRVPDVRLLGCVVHLPEDATFDVAAELAGCIERIRLAE